MRRIPLLFSLLLTTAAGALQFGPAHPVASTPFAPAPTILLTPAAASSNDGVLVAWVDVYGIRAARLDASRNVVDEPALLVAPRPWRNDWHFTTRVDAVVSDGSSFLIAWSESFWNGKEHVFEHWLTRVASDGTFATSEPREGRWVGAVWTGDRVVALRGSTFFGAFEVLATDVEGRVLDRKPLSLPTARFDDASRFMLVDGRQVWLVGDEYPPRFYRLRLTDEDGDLSPRPAVSLPIDLAPAGEGLYSAGVAGNHWYLISWANGVTVRFLDRYTMRQVVPPITIDRRRTPLALGVAVGDDLFVAYSGKAEYLGGDYRDTLTVHRVTRGGRVTAALIDAPIYGPQRVVCLAADGSRGASLLWVEQSRSHSYNHTHRSAMMATHIAEGPLNGFVVSEPVLISRSLPVQARVHAAAIGTGAVAVWEQPGMFETEIHAAPLSADGSPAGPSHFVLHGRMPRIASSGDVGLVVAETRRGIMARRVGADASPLDAEPGRMNDMDSYGLHFDVVWDGAAFVVAYEGYREPIRGTRVGAGGEILASLVPLTTEPRSSVDWRHPLAPALAVGPEGVLLVWSYLRLEAAPWSGTALYARGFTRDLQPRTPPFLLSVFDGTPRVAWGGAAFSVAWVNVGLLRATRLRGDFTKIDSDFGYAVAEANLTQGPFELGGRLFAAASGRLVQLDPDPPRASLALPADITNMGTLVRVADGRTLLLYTVIDEDGRYRIERARARVVTE